MQQLPMLSLPRVQIQLCSGEYSKFDVGIIRPISRTEVLGAFLHNFRVRSSMHGDETVGVQNVNKKRGILAVVCLVNSLYHNYSFLAISE